MIYGKDEIQVQTVSAGYEDERGDWHEGEARWDTPRLCDAQPATTSANTIGFPDGELKRYSYVVTADVDFPQLAVGTKVLLTADGEVQELTVKGMHRYAFQTKLWV